MSLTLFVYFSREIIDAQTMKSFWNVSSLLVIFLLASGIISSCSKEQESLSTSITDPRDGQVYPTIVIGNQCWLQMNLNFEIGNSWCYDNDPANCEIYGRLYDWETVMQGALSSDSVPSGVQGICPPGWHIPSNDEWSILIDYLGGPFMAAGKMRSINGWYENGNGDNSSGFTALPGGATDSNGNFIRLTSHAYFWSSTELSSIRAWDRSLPYDDEIVYNGYNYKSNGFSCRCLKD
jgi:uncharacterized protein (TIGR02145 family)